MLSNELISQFVKITQSDNTRSKQSMGYGTVVINGDTTYVRFDGSELLTRVKTTTELKDGERVVVTIKNHEAIVTGNTSSPSVGQGTIDGIRDDLGAFSILIADKASIKDLEAETARINELVADNVTIRDKLVANEAYISDLVADNITINEKLVAVEAEIKSITSETITVGYLKANYADIDSLRATNAKVYNLEATYGDFQRLVANDFEAITATIESLDNKYANIDFSNIGKAAIEEFFAQSGLIKDVIIGDGTITGELVGVTIRGDLIEGNTIVADKLVIKGTDGLYYKLNTDGVTTEAEQTDYNSLNGQVIRAKSVTAEKIAVSDLVAFDATIGGFFITDHDIHSGVKETVHNTTRGIYMDKNGQLALGDSRNFVKYYIDQNGKGRLEISADSLIFSSSGNTVEDTINDKFNSISVGGKNLIRNSRTMIYDDYYFSVDSGLAEGDYILDESGNTLLDESNNKLAV